MSIVPTSVVLFIFGLSGMLPSQNHSSRQEGSETELLLLGLVNVLLFFLTRPKLLLFNVRRGLRSEPLEGQLLSQIAQVSASFPRPRYSYRTLYSSLTESPLKDRGTKG